MKYHALPLWTVVNLSLLVKLGLPSAFVCSDAAVALFTSKTLADAFIDESEGKQDYVARPVETTRELSWFFTSLERSGIEHVSLNPGLPASQLWPLAELRATMGVDTND
jgi:hypothetical protein